MTTPIEDRLRKVADALVVVLLSTAALRLLAAVVAGIASTQDNVGPPGRFATGERIATFGAAGDAANALLLLVAVAVVAVLFVPARAGGVHETVTARRACAAAGWLLALTALSAVLVMVGISVEAASVHLFERLAGAIGFAVAALAASVGGLYVVRRLLFVSDDVAYSLTEADAESPAAVFAIDRRNGDVLAWPTMQQAVLEAPVYGVADDEYEFFLDDGTVLVAGVVDDRVQLTPTETARFDDLIGALKDFALRRDIAIDDEETDEPLAYVDPVNRQRWLLMWPGWLRWIARIVRPPR